MLSGTALESMICRGGGADRLTRWIAVIGFTGLIIVSLVTMTDILLRWLFNSPLEGLEDVTRYTFAVVIATCLPAGLVQGHNVTIRFLGGALGRRTALWLETLGAIATLAFLALLVWRFGVFAHDEAVHGRFTLTLGMPTAPWWWMVTALLAICTAVQSLVVVVRVNRAFVGRVAADQHDEIPDFLADAEGLPPGGAAL